jgi:hypothetical protein
MKKLFIAAVVLVAMSVQAIAGEIVITIRTKSTWDGASKVCINSDRGLCMRINALAQRPESTEFNGKISFDRTQGIVIKIAKTEISKFNCFSNGVLKVDGDSPIAIDILNKISFPNASKGFTLNAGTYKYLVEGDEVIVIIPLN